MQHLRAINDYYYLAYDIYFWRTRSQLEVDFVLYGEKGLLAFEIKNSAGLNTKDFKGLNAFKTDYPMADCYMIYMGDSQYYQNDIKVMPMRQALFDLGKILGGF